MLHSPHYDANAGNAVYGIKSPVDIMPYAMALSSDGDGENPTSFVWQIRAINGTGNFANLTSTNTNVRGTATITSFEENDAHVVNFQYTSVIPANTSWGLYLSGLDSSYAGEIVMKVNFYQV